MQELSIVIPTWNEEGNIIDLVERIHNTFSLYTITYQIIFIDDHSTDNTVALIESLAHTYPIVFFQKKGNKGKAQSLIEGFAKAKYDLICMIDADLQYQPEVIPQMIQKISEGADMVVANRKVKQTSTLRTFISNSYSLLFNKILHNFDFDVQSGLKVFKKEIIEHIHLQRGFWAIDLEFLIKANSAGYKIVSYDIIFAKRNNGKAKINLFKASLELGMNALMLKFRRADIIPFHPKMLLSVGRGFHYKGKSFVHHSNLSPTETAFHRLSGMQTFIIIALSITFIIALFINWHLTLTIFVASITILYFADLLFNLYLITRNFSNPAEISSTTEEINAISESNWPSYTIFCPLYKEAHVVPQFVTSMSRMDYPKDKLQVMLLLEEDDTETIEQIRTYSLPSYFTIVVVPHSLPKTKPKACNYGLLYATGEYTVIYDAEDIPDPLQLKKAVLAFTKEGKTTVCIQAKLNFYNPHQNLLTRVFTAEYSLWFDLVLTGLQSIQAPIPLGGTSNHFRTQDLHKLKGWDSFNVTEDADLGMRLVKKGYKTAIIDSVTLEEANSCLSNWFGQRSRWIKGYIQTYLVHMRNPNEFVNRGRLHLITFQLIIGGKIMSMFINPLMWLITISYFVLRIYIGPFIETFFPMPILYMGIFSLVLGNFLYLYYYILGCIKHEHDALIKYIFLIPLYWLAMSGAAWVAFYKLFTAPHHWSKTKHGLHLGNLKASQNAAIAIGDQLVDANFTPNTLNSVTSSSIAISKSFTYENLV